MSKRRFRSSANYTKILSLNPKVESYSVWSLICLSSAQWCEMTNSSPVGGKVGKKMEKLGNIQNVGSWLFSVNHDLTLCSIFSSILVLFLKFSIQVKGKTIFFSKWFNFILKIQFSKWNISQSGKKWQESLMVLFKVLIKDNKNCNIVLMLWYLD